jgi:hypothetical protein
MTEHLTPWTMACEICGSHTISLVCGDDTRPAKWTERLRRPLLWLRRFLTVFEISAWCADHAGMAVRPGIDTICYWLPEPRTLTWREAFDHTKVEQPGCCHCDGKYGPTEFAVWAADEPADWSEGYCASCMADQTTWNEGRTYARLAPQYTIPGYGQAAEAAWVDRKPIPTELIIRSAR